MSPIRAILPVPAHQPATVQPGEFPVGITAGATSISSRGATPRTASRTWQPRSNTSLFFTVCALHVVIGYLLIMFAPQSLMVARAKAVMVSIAMPMPENLVETVKPKPILEAPKPNPNRVNDTKLSLDPLLPTPTPVLLSSTVESSSIAIATDVNASVATSNLVAPQTASAPAAAREVQPPQFDADYLNNPAPSYPSLSRRAGEQGRVLLRVHVDASGVADAVEIKDSCGFPRLDAAAMEAVRKWKFVAAKAGNSAVAAWVVVPINFSLKG
jgi:periplasmic protein TonB